MLSHAQEQKIAQILNEPNVTEIIAALLERYAAASPDNCLHLISNITEISSKAMEIMNNKFNEARQCAAMAVTQRYFNKEDLSTYFASSVPIAKMLFPEGNADRCSVGLQKYFNEFEELANNKQAYNPETDREWAKEYGYLDYLSKVVKPTKVKDE